MKLSEHFDLSEAIASDTAERLGLDNTPSDTVLQNMKKAAVGLELVRSLLLVPISISSWYRSLLLNRAIGSSDTSAHRQGWAIDFKAPAFGTPKDICEAIVKSDIKFDQLIFEGSWVHISFDPLMKGQKLTAIFQKGKKTKYVPYGGA